MNLDIKKIRDRVLVTQQALRKQAADDGGVADPNDRGQVTPQKDPKSDPALANVPPNNLSGVSATRDQTLLNALKPSQTGENVPSAGRQEPKDEAATSPTTDLGKIAARAQKVKDLLKPQPKAAAAPAAVTPPPADGWDPDVRQKMANALGIDETALEQLTPDKLAEITRDRLVKIATLALEAEGGVETISELLEKKAGADEARLVLQQAVNSYGLMTKEASYEEQQAAEYVAALEQTQMEALSQFQELTKNASASDVKAMAQFNAAVDHGTRTFLGDQPQPELFEAYLSGMKQAAADLAMMEQGQAPEGMPPEEGEMPPEMAEGEEAEGGGEEELLAALEQALQEGQISPEQAAQLMEELQAAAGGPDTPENVVEEDIEAASAGLGL
jgi:hypothetical protein